MRTILLAMLSATALGAADPGMAPVPDPPSTVCHAKPEGLAEVVAIAPADAILPGYGSGGFTIRTSNPEAQAFFDNGMQLAHAFSHDAAIAAFKRAELLDPQCAMCVWGEAWSRGPTINYPIDAKTAIELAALADRAAALSTDANPAERAWIAALQKRYREGRDHVSGDLAFADAMEALSRSRPADDEIAIVAADALLIQSEHEDHSRRLDRALDLLKTVLARAPDDSGAIHFYIHATEMNGVGAQALPYAERLQGLAPAASHLVHMPSHTYFWVGRFRAAEQANIDAVAIQQADALRRKPKDGIFGLEYHQHNVQFGIVAALVDGDGDGALALAKPMIERLPSLKPDQAWPQIATAAAYAAYGRFASDETVAALPEPDATMPFAKAMWRYARGEAAARRGDRAKVDEIAATMTSQRDDLKTFGDSADRGRMLIDIARLVLQGRAAMMDGRWSDAIAAYRKAADLQDDELGTDGDPPVWWYPVRRSLAAAMLADGRLADAAEELRKTLLVRVGDPLSERIFADDYAASGKTDEAKRWMDAARSGWAGDPAAVPKALL